ncbi:MAG: TonB-dependent receptor [Proteobacteria bacterium]|nr:TonB-dependent receptor [Pseudomonadota bacterium]
MRNIYKKLLLPVMIAAALPVTVQAQEESENMLEVVAVTGTRVKHRSVEDSPVPVDVLSSDDLLNTGATELGRALQVLAPSFNFSSSSISDGSDALRPATLRGLGPDQTLVLVNGKRRHNSSLIHVNTSVGRGTAGTDLNAIPISAIQRVEILRDGAAAQYGSDAIAGVINIVLRDASDEGFVGFEAGQTYEGDGTTYIANANNGFAVGSDGFLNMTYEYRKRDATNRAGLSGKRQYPCTDGVNIDYGCSVITTLDPREADFDRQNFRIGDSDSEQHAFVANFALPMGDDGELYAFFTYSERENQSGGFYRAAVDSTKTILADYPDGFLPLINTTIDDWSGFGGYRFTINDWDYDASIGTARNSFNFFISNSQNASLGPGSQTSADAGTLYLTQTTANFDASKVYYNNNLALNVAWGAEYRQDDYRIIPGEPASYVNGGAVNPVTGQDYNAGFQVFRGFSPRNAVEEDRNSYALYLDIEKELSEKWLLAGALRYEDYSDFGSVVIGKLSTRYEISDSFALRGSASTGFRAPSMQQLYFNSISTQFVSGPNGGLIAEERGTFRNDSDVAAAVGVPELKEEESVNFSVGFTFDPDNAWVFSADYYFIDIEDRIILSGAIKTSNPVLPPGVVAGMEALGITSAQFFTNAGSTETSGIDLVATWGTEFSNGTSYDFAGSANWTETTVGKGVNTSGLPDGLADVLFTSQDQSMIEEWQPTTHFSLTNTFEQNAWRGVLQLSYFGEYTVEEGNGDRQTFGGKGLVDASVSYAFNGGFVLTLGANNLFDTMPDKNKIGQSRGGTIDGIVDSPGVFTYSRRSAPFGINGGYYYLKGVYRF